jgi:HK97 family phage major capsid protein
VIETGKTQQLPIEQLRALAGDAAAFGDDVIGVFTAQAERRALAAGDILKAAETEARDLLASENRMYEKTMREAESIRALQAHVEARTAAKGFVPASQTRTETTPTETAVSPVLKADQRMVPWLKARGRYTYQGDQGADTMRLGAIVAALASGRREHLTDLERRALAEGTDSTGGFLVPEVLASTFIDRVRDALVVQKAGAQIVPMSTEVVHLARLAQPGIANGSPLTNMAPGAWKLENDLIDEGSLTLERATLTARTLPLLLKMSVELFEDASNISQIVEDEMAKSTALELDRVALVGSGTPPEPRGLLNTTGVLTGTLGTPANWDFLITAAGQLWTVNQEPNSFIYGTAAAIAIAKLKSSVDAQPLVMPHALDGIKQFRSNVAGAKGYLGDFSNLLLGMRTSFRIEVTRVGAGAFERLQVAIRSYVRADVTVAHANAFNLLT